MKRFLSLLLALVLLFTVVPSAIADSCVDMLSKAAAYLAAKEYTKAIASYQIAQKLQPDDERAYLGEADVYILLEDYSAAASLIDAALAVCPDSADARYLKCKVDLLLWNHSNSSLVSGSQAIVNKGDDLLIAEQDSNKNSEYHKLGTVYPPDGYYLTDEDMTSTSSTVKYTTEFVYRPTDESGNTMVCVKGVGKSVDGMIDYVYDSFASLVEASEDDAISITEVTDLDTPSGKARYFIYTYSYESETDAGTTETKYTQYLVCYVPAYYKNSCVLVSVSINADSPDQFVANEVLETEMQKAIDAITIDQR